MRRFFCNILIAIAAIVCFTDCSNVGSREALLPNISGKAGEVLVVMSKDDWQGNAGTIVREILADDCPGLPQKEPLYTLVNVQPSGFGKMFKVHRNIIYFNIGAADTLGTERLIFRNDVWAKPQCVVQVNSASADSAAAMFKEKASLIVNTLEQAERDRVISNTLHYENISLPEHVKELTGGTAHFSTGYSLKKQTENFIWIADEKQYTNQGVFIYKYPAYTVENPFALETIIAKRNEILKENVPGMFENTYMITNEVATPSINFLKYKGREFVETRGLWEVYNDYMGGPFVSHTFYSPDGKDVIVLEAFVYAPKYDKRQYLRQVESMLYTFSWKD